MKKYLLWIPAFAGMTMLLTSSLYSEDIYFKSGFVLKNIKILDSLDHYLRVELVPKRERTFAISTIEKIGLVKFDSLYESGFERWKEDELVNFSDKPTDPIIRKRGAKYDRPNMKLIPISFISFGLSYAYLTSAKDFPSVNKHRAIVPGVLFAIGGIVNLFYSFEKVEIRTDGQQLSLLYTF